MSDVNGTALTELREENERLQRELGQRDAVIEELRSEIAELRRLLEESRRSGKRQAAPFSKGTPKPDAKRPGRKGAGRDGRHSFRGAPHRAPDRVIEVPLPETCLDCGSSDISSEKVVEQWTEDIPEPSTVITRFDIEVGRCAGCTRRVQARHPEQVSDAIGAAGSMLGPRALGLAAELHYGAGMSFAKVSATLLRLGLSVTPGGVTQALARLGSRGTPTYDALVEALRRAPVVAPDETGWRIGGNKAWLWAFATPELTVYMIANGRGYDDAVIVLGKDYSGTLCRDGWAIYRRFDNASHQTCLAHLFRRCHELTQSSPEHLRWIPTGAAEVFGAALAIREARDTAVISSDELEEAINGLQGCIDTLTAVVTPDDEIRKLLAHLERERGALFTFLRDPQVDATNWRAEQAIRPAVVNRKVWGGNRTHNGARTAQVIMTLLRTAVQQGTDAITMFIDLLRSPTPMMAPLIPNSGADP